MVERQRRRVVKVIRAGGKRIEDVTDLDLEDLPDLEKLVDIEREEEDDGTMVMKIRVRKPPGGAEADPLARAAGVSGAIDDLRAEVGQLVRRARGQGYTWTQVGDALGISKQAAWERFSGEE